MNVEQARELIEQHEAVQRALAEAREVLHESAEQEAVREQRERDIATSRPGGDEEEEALTVAIGLLERLRKSLVSGPQTDDVRKTLRWIDEGVYHNQGFIGPTEGRLAKVLSRPEIARFAFKRPGLATFERRLQELRAEREPEASASDEKIGAREPSGSRA